MGSLRMIVALLTALVAALILALPSGVASAAYSGPVNQAYCQDATKLLGTWSASTCTIPAGTTGTIPSGDHVETYGDNTNGRLQIYVSSGATLVVEGVLSLNGGGATGSLVNGGTVTVSASGQIDVNWDPVDATSYGWLKNTSAGTLTNNGILNVNTSPGATSTCAGAGAFDNAGTFINNLMLANYSPCLTNSGTMTNNGEYTNGGGKLDIQAGTVTNNHSVHINSGQVIVETSLVNSNTGTIWLGNVADSQGATLWVNAGNTTFTNNGDFYVNSLSAMTSDSSNPVTNNGTLHFHGSFYSYYFTNASGSLIENYGTFTIHSGATNAGQFDNKAGGTLTIQSSAHFTNQNLFNNWGTIVNSIWGHFVNSSGATVENYGAFNNDTLSYVTNDGTINDYCGSTFTFPTSGPYFTGNQPVNYCIAPAFTSANHTTFVVGQAGTFNVTTSGLPVPTLFADWAVLPSGVTFTNHDDGTGTLAGTPALGTTGSYSLTFTAINNVPPNATQNFTLTVNQAPAITSGDTATFTYGAHGSFTVTATGYPTPTFSLDTSGFGGLTFNTTTGVLSGTPTNTGSVTRTLTASNGVSPNATQNFHLIVNRAGTTTTLTSSPSAPTFGQTVTLTATVAPAAATGTVQFYADSAPLGSAVTVSSGSASTSTSSLTVGTHPIAATYSGNTNYNGSSSNQINQQVLCGNPMTVSNANDSGAGSLRDALANVCSAGTITFSGDYTIHLQSELTISRGVTIDGAGHSVVVSGNNAVRVFWVNPGVTFNLNALTVADGNVDSDPLHSDGGGIYNQGTLNATHVSFSGNSGRDGGGLNTNGSASLTNVTFSGNSAGRGGGMYNNQNSVTLTNVTFSGNQATGINGSGGGMYNSSSSPTLTNVTFTGNTATSTGGGMDNDFSNPTLINATFTGNYAALGGSGMYNVSTLVTSPSTPTVQNSILWGDTSDEILNAGYSTPTVTYSVVQGGYSGTGNINADPLLGTLGNYGGGTETVPLLPGSAAIDAGSNTNCPTTDQRGKNRVGTCDIGAFESQGFTLGSPTGTPQSTAPNTAFATPLGLTVSSLQGEPVAGGKVTFAPPGGGASAVITGSPATIAANGTVSVTATANGTPGSYNVTASAAGAATSVNFALTNTKLDTTTTLISSPNPSSSGQAVSLTATVAPAAATGSVQFYADGATLGSAVAVSSTSTSSLTVGTHPITATYSGDTNHNASTSNQVNQAVCSTAIVVTNNANSGAGSLRDALANVCAGGTITFNGDHSITLASTLTVNKNVTIDGTGHTVTVSGNNAVRVFDVPAGVTAILQNLTVTRGYCLGCNGGAIRNYGILTVSKGTLSDNSSPNGYGGGIYNYGVGTVSLNNSTLVGNSTNNNGGAIGNAGTMTVNNSTFSNGSALNGGGISNSGTLTMTNSSLSGNSATSGAGGVRNTGTLTIRNSIITKGSTGSNCEGAIGGSNNLANDATCGAGFTNSSSILLGALGNYGGSTMTIPLLPGSAALDAGDVSYCPATDQRGIARPQGAHCDIGAFESRGFTLTTSGGDNQSTLANTAFAAPLAVSVTSANGEPVNGGQVTFTAPSSGASTTFAPTTVVTIASGAASTSATANATPGTYNVTATAAGAATPAQFALTNTSPAPMPTLTSISPTSAAVNAPDFTLTVTGTNFIATSVVRWNGGNRPTTYISSTKLTATIAKNDLSAAGTANVTVYTPTPGGGTSNAVPFTISSTNSTVSLTASCSPCLSNRPLTFTATVTNTVGGSAAGPTPRRSPNAVPGGTTTFKKNGTNITGCVAVALNGAGQAVCTTTLPGGPYTITAHYSGDANFNPASGTLTLNVNYGLFLPNIRK